MKRDDFKTSVTNQSPSEELPKPLAALWWQKKGDWDKAHVIVQSDKTKDSIIQGQVGHAQGESKGGHPIWSHTF